VIDLRPYQTGCTLTLGEGEYGLVVEGLKADPRVGKVVRTDPQGILVRVHATGARVQIVEDP